jgi:hypothetical protein
MNLASNLRIEYELDLSFVRSTMQSNIYTEIHCQIDDLILTKKDRKLE